MNKRGADMNKATAVGGMTALLTASWRGDLLGVKTMLKLGREGREGPVEGQGPGGTTVLDLAARGRPPMTSVCGSRGPHTAAGWARRKAVVCPDKAFAAIAKLLDQAAGGCGGDVCVGDGD